MLKISNTNWTYVVASLDLIGGSNEYILIPLSVFTEDHLWVRRRDDECSGIDREWRIDCPPKQSKFISDTYKKLKFHQKLPILLISLPMPASWERCRNTAGHGEAVPGDLCGVKSDHTRDTCWSKIDWSLSSSTCSFRNISSVRAAGGIGGNGPRRPASLDGPLASMPPAPLLSPSSLIIWFSFSFMSWSRLIASSFGNSTDHKSFSFSDRKCSLVRCVRGTCTIEFVSLFSWACCCICLFSLWRR